MKLNFILPFFPLKPGGGCKIMYEYANRFGEKGYDVQIYHVTTLPYMKYKYPHWLRYLRNNILYIHSKPAWFTFNSQVKVTNIPFLENKYVRDADCSISTMWATAIKLDRLSKTKGKKINLIQGYELWIGNNQKMLHHTYKLPMIHIVISDFLADIVKRESGISPNIIYNGIDNSVFYIKKEIKERNPYSVSMLYSTDENKGTEYGLEALKKCHDVFPKLKVELFGVYSKPLGLPDWMHYNQNPVDLCSIYNSTAIFFTPSNNEGWGLPATEAMFCGCALICTNIEGYNVFAKDGDTCLTTLCRDSNDMSQKILDLLRNSDKRIQIACRGHEFIQQFSWERAINDMENIIENRF